MGNKKKWLLLALVFACIAVAGYTYWKRTRLEQYLEVQSPDHRFRLVVYRRPIWPSTMPGQGSDAPGIVRLYDQSGRLLDESPIEMVQQIHDVHWRQGRVEVPLVFSFKLPD